jgi:sulfur-oxidizing protein SoxY
LANPEDFFMRAAAQKTSTPPTTRRQALAHSAALATLLLGAGVLPQTAQAAWAQAAFEGKTMADAVQALGGGAPVESKDVSFTGPDIAENGAVVPVACASSAVAVKRMLVLVDKNPNPLAAVFEVSDSLEPSFKTRVKMAQTSNVYAVAMLADGKVLYAVKEIKVTLGGCGG